MFQRLVLFALVVIPASAFAQVNSKSSAFQAVNLGFEHGPTFRGTNPTGTGQAFSLAGEYSSQGLSFGFVESLASERKSSQTELFATYSYPLGWIEVSGGLQGFLNVDTGHRDSLELLIEVRTEPICGFNFFLGQYLELTHGFHSYTEFKVSRRFDPVPRFAFEPYSLISFGNYNSDTYTFNHAQIGLDSEWVFSDRVTLGLYGGVVFPMAGVEGKMRESSTHAVAGFRLTYRF